MLVPTMGIQFDKLTSTFGTPGSVKNIVCLGNVVRSLKLKTTIRSNGRMGGNMMIHHDKLLDLGAHHGTIDFRQSPVVIQEPTCGVHETGSSDAGGFYAPKMQGLQ